MKILLAHIRYARYVLRHKWFVFLECVKLGIIWQGITHDLSKLTPREWIPYVGVWELKDRERYEEAYKKAWQNHIKVNPHHWQAWLYNGVALPMPDRYRKEMLADWLGMARTLNKSDKTAWYLEHRETILLHPETRKWVEEHLFNEQPSNDGNTKQASSGVGI